MSKFLPGKSILGRSSSAHPVSSNSSRDIFVEEGDKVATLFKDIKAKNDNVVSNIKLFLIQTAKDSGPEHFQTVVSRITSEIFSLTNSGDLNDKILGITVMDGLIEYELEHSSNALHITRLSNYITQVLETEELEVMKKATSVLGKLVRFEGGVAAEIVDSEIRESFTWLKNSDEYKIIAAVLILQTLAVNAPSQFYVHVSDFFKAIWTGLTSTKQVTRECASDSLRVVLELTATRKGRLRLQWLDTMWQHSLAILKKQQSSDHMHGALLVIRELIGNAKELMIHRVKEVSENVLKLKDFSTRGDKGIIKKTVVLMMPKIAAFSPEMFFRFYFKSCTEFLISILNSKDESLDKSSPFAALAELLTLLPSSSFVESFIPNILLSIKTNLNNRKQFCYESILCLSALSGSVKHSLIPSSEWDELLPTVFIAGLDEQVTSAIRNIGNNISSKMIDIQIMLIQLIGYIITRKPYTIHRIPVIDSREKIKDKDILPNQKLLTAWSTIQVDDKLITLALQTLASFGFEKELVLEFVRDIIVDYLDNDNASVRRDAVIACANTIRPTEKKLSATALSVIRQVFEKLLIVGIADTDPSVRITVLESFDETFDEFLAMAENLRSLFIALNDEVFDVRKLSIRMIGRLTLRNPACVMPSMRKTLVQLLTELEFSGDSIKEESATLLGHLINSSKQLIKPYCEPILKALLDKLNDENSRVASAVLQTTGELSMVAGSEVEKHLPQLLPTVIESLKDKSSTRKRYIALRALGHFIESTGEAIKPLYNFPKLMDILLIMVKTERIESIREELIKVLGILGAIDPFQYKLIHQKATEKSDKKENYEDILSTISPSSEDYCSTAAIIALMKILQDSSLGVYHSTVIDSMLSILSSQDESQIPLLVPLIMPPFLNRLRSSDPVVREALLIKSGDIVHIVGDHLVDFLGEIFELIIYFWNSGSNIMALLSLIESLGDIFTVHFPDLIPQILSTLHKDFSDTGEWDPIAKVLHTLEVIAHNLDDYLHLIIPALVRLMEQVYLPIEIRKATILTIGRLSFELNFEDYASRIGHPLARILETEPLLRDEVMDTLCALVYQLWTNYAIVVQVVNKVMIKQKISHKVYDGLVTALLKKLQRPTLSSEFLERMKPRKAIRKSSITSSSSNNIKNNDEFIIDKIALQKAWKTSNRTTKEDWNEWMRKFSVELLRNSSSKALRTCFDFAQRYNSLAMQLFNPAFLSVWNALGERMRDQLVQVILNALSSPDSPPEIMQIILNCLEWMERDGKPITAIGIKKLGEFGTQCHAYAKALHYKEIEFREKVDSQTIEELISLNNQLQQPEAAVGILTFAQKQHDVKFYPSWFIKLQRWNDALEVFKNNENSIESIKHKISCYYALGEWNQLLDLVDNSFEHEQIRSEISPYGASAAWHLGNWERMEQLIKGIDESFEFYFYQSILSIHKDDFIKAQKYIGLARRQMDNELTALVSESYHRAYDEFVSVQQLSEMEEVIQYKQSKDDPSRRKMIIQLWENRISGCQRNVDVWERILMVRSLVLSPKEDPNMWLKFAKLCRKNDELQSARKFFKQLWAEGDKKQAFEGMQTFCKNLETLNSENNNNNNNNNLNNLNINNNSNINNINIINNNDSNINNNYHLLSRCHLKLGQWRKARSDELNTDEIPEIIESFKKARLYSPNWYKAWNEWAYINFEVLSLYDKNQKSSSSSLLLLHKNSGNKNNNNDICKYLIACINGFFQCIALSPNQSLQDTLRVLTLWFNYGDRSNAIKTLKEGFDLVSIDTWLQVIPQIIARIHSPANHIRKLIQELLIKVGKAHPQALVFPLTVASKSTSNQSSDVAQIILNQMKKHSNHLVEQTSMVSNELIRVSIVWHEMWHEALEEASRCYFNENNTDGMLERLFSMYKEVERGPETLREVAFEQSFGRDLKLALEWCKKYQKTKEQGDINQAWDIYSSIFRRITKMMGQMKTFDLEYVSPYLLNAHDLDLAIPGTYRANSQIIKIKSFGRNLKVFSSKQRPRQMSMNGTDGECYSFLLKGHEDLRQDERVMQLFGLVNTLLNNDTQTSASHLNITRYYVIPLSPNSGVIGWVPNCDTLLKLIQDYRSSKGIELRTEHKRVFQMIPPDQYDNLTLFQKVEIFEHALASTTGEDINHVLWLKSKNAESWLERRLIYTRSLALMSMVGYILGLGDRHPSNLMLERINGKIVHIDFGDCFEVAMTRDKYPEKVPFRLTRMLIKAMEASQIEGNFRTTCENVMRVMRANKESLMAVLEAFVHDPLLNWRLLGAEAPSDQEVTQEDQNTDLRRATPLSRKQPQSGSKMSNSIGMSTDGSTAPEVLNEKAVEVITRVQQKLTGTDFTNSKLTVEEQVAKLIDQATSSENLSQGYFGWCPFW